MFLDAVVVRCLLLPAVLLIVGEATWALPDWLARLLPRLNIEGTSLRGGGQPQGRREGEVPPAGVTGRGRSPGVAAEGADG